MESKEIFIQNFQPRNEAERENFDVQFKNAIEESELKAITEFEIWRQINNTWFPCAYEQDRTIHYKKLGKQIYKTTSELYQIFKQEQQTTK